MGNSNTIVLSLEVDDNGTVKVKQFADGTKKFFEEMKNGPAAAQGPLDKLKDSWVGLATKVGATVAAFYAAKRIFYDTGKEIASTANDIERQAKMLAISTDEFQKWQYAAKMSDVNAQEFAIGMKYLSKNMEDASSGTGEAAKYFSAMGVAIKTADGQLRPLNDVMRETMDEFAAWESGPRKIAIALQLFGRSGENLLPLLNQGRAGFEEFSREAERLGIILSPDLVRKGSEAEDTFKKIDAQIQATKLNCAPLSYEFSKLLFSMSDGLRMLREEAERDPIRNWINTKLPEYARQVAEFTGITKSIQYPSYEPGPWSPTRPPKKPPAIGGGPEDAEREKRRELLAEAIKQQYEAEGWFETAIPDETYRLKLLNEALDKEKEKRELLAGAIKQQYEAEGWFETAIPDETYKLKLLNEALDKEKEKRELLAEAIKRQYEAEGWFEETTPSAAYQKWLIEEKTAKAAQQSVREFKRAATEGEILAQRFGEAWNFNLKNIISQSESMGDAVKNIFYGIADASSSAVSRMISDWMLFGNVSGKYQTGKGVIGWLGASLGSILPGFQHGGDFWVNRPTPIMVGEGGRRERVTITPEGQAGAGQVTNNYYYYIMNPIGFDEALLRSRHLIGNISRGAIAEDKRFNRRT